MKGYWSMAMVGLVSVVSIGCVPLEKYQALERANRILDEKASQLQQDLLESESLIAQKDTQITSLRGELDTKDRLVASLTLENVDLRKRYDQAYALLESQAGRGGNVTIISPALPPGVDEALRKLAQDHSTVLEYDPKTGSVRWKADLLFDLGTDRISLSADVQEAMAEFAQIISRPEVGNYDVIVVGHTCTTRIAKPATLAEHKTNWHLSAHRAISVMDLLADKNVQMTRLGVMGYGEFRPIAENSSESGKAKNRRVEIFLVPKNSVLAIGQGLHEATDMGIAFARP
jgi:chemotaxis protein MotB